MPKKATRLVGITVLPEYLQSEGIEQVLDNIVERAGANAVATSPYVMREGDEATGGREPPIDAGAGSVRLLDRPLWGKRELWVETAPSFVPDKSLYEGLRYQPAEPTELTSRSGIVIQQFIEAAHDRGLQVYLQVQAAIPPGYRVQFGGPVDEDQPRLPDGRVPGRRVDKNGSLASQAIIDYQHALIRDLCRAYPDVDALRFDWPEYPPYLIDSSFVDFSDHVSEAARQSGLDFESMRLDVQQLYEKLHGGLDDDAIENWLAECGQPGRCPRSEFWSGLGVAPGVRQYADLKSKLVDQYVRGLREVVDEASGKSIRMAPTAFPPPWTYISGLDFEQSARHCDELAVKLYSMHWQMMLRFYGDQLRETNPGVSSRLLAQSLIRLLDTGQDEDGMQVEDFHYPAPDEPHQIGEEPQVRKIRLAQEAAGDTPIRVLAHGYGPVEDFRTRIGIASRASEFGFWVNRYGYLADEKLDAIGEVNRATK